MAAPKAGPLSSLNINSMGSYSFHPPTAATAVLIAIKHTNNKIILIFFFSIFYKFIFYIMSLFELFKLISLHIIIVNDLLIQRLSFGINASSGV
jgi:hypothetical protein